MSEPSKQGPDGTSQLKSANQATLTLLSLTLLVKAGFGERGVSYKTFPEAVLWEAKGSCQCFSLLHFRLHVNFMCVFSRSHC